MNKWDTDKLINLTHFIKDGTHGTHKDTDDGIPLLSAKDVANGRINIPDDCRRISMSDYEIIHSNYELNQGDLLLTIVGTIGRSAIVESNTPKITFQRSVAIIRPDETRLLPHFGYYYLNSEKFLSALDRAKNASAQGGVYLGELEKININFPLSKRDQKKIVDILSTLDSVIEKTEAAIAKYKAIKQGMLHDLFTRGIDSKTGKLRPKYKDASQLYKKSELGWIPKEWKIKKLSECCFEPNGVYGINAAAVDYNPKLPVYIRITDINESGEFLNENKKCVISEFADTYILKKNEIVFARTGATVGKTYLFNANDGELVYAGFLIKFHPIPSALNSSFLKFYTETSGYWNWVNIMSTRSGQPGINGIEYGTKLIPVPLIHEQKLIQNKLWGMQKLITKEKKYCLKLNQIKKGLMADLLSGKIEVKIKPNL